MCAMLLMTMRSTTQARKTLSYTNVHVDELSTQEVELVSSSCWRFALVVVSSRDFKGYKYAYIIAVVQTEPWNHGTKNSVNFSKLYHVHLSLHYITHSIWEFVLFSCSMLNYISSHSYKLYDICILYFYSLFMIIIVFCDSFYISFTIYQLIFITRKVEAVSTYNSYNSIEHRVLSWSNDTKHLYFTTSFAYRAHY